MFNDKEYLAIETKFNKMKTEYVEKMEHGIFDKGYLSTLKTEMENELQSDLQGYYENNQRTLEEEMGKIKADYVKEQEALKPDAPTQLLKRQELQMKMELSSEVELKNMLKSYQATAQGDKLELDHLRVEMRKRGMQEEEIHLKAYMDEYNAGEEWANLPEYQEKQQKWASTQQYRRTGLLHIGEGDDRKVVQLKVSKF